MSNAFRFALAAAVVVSSLAYRAYTSYRADSPKSAVVAKCVTASGTIMRREAYGKPWQKVKHDENISSGDLLLGLPGAALQSKNGAVRLTLLTDLDGNSPFPVIESAVILRDNSTFDLDFTLDRGRVDLINHKEKGPATVRVHVRDQHWDLTLSEPGVRVGLELMAVGRGVPFVKDPKPDHMPTADLAILVLKGQVSLKYQKSTHLMQAPPGPALFEWDSKSGGDVSPVKLEKLPAWAEAGSASTPAGKTREAAIKHFREVLHDKSLDAALEQFVKSDNLAERRLAVVAMAAFDDLTLLGKTMREAKHPDIWDNGVRVLRHWIGRGPGQDQKLYKMLLEESKFPPAQAETTMQLLHSFSTEEVAQPETYEMLIDYLNHDRLAIRGLAYWHLIRLAPEGKSIAYNPQDPKEKREQARLEWKKLIPTDKLPPKKK